MRPGLAPIGADGRSINIHHILQMQDRPLIELQSGTHFGYYFPLHINAGTKAPLLMMWVIFVISKHKAYESAGAKAILEYTM